MQQVKDNFGSQVWNYVCLIKISVESTEESKL